MQITKALVVLSLIGNGAIVNAISLRRAHQPPAATGAVSFSAQVNSDDVDYKVKTPPARRPPARPPPAPLRPPRSLAYEKGGIMSRNRVHIG